MLIFQLMAGIMGIECERLLADLHTGSWRGLGVSARHGACPGQHITFTYSRAAARQWPELPNDRDGRGPQNACVIPVTSCMSGPYPTSSACRRGLLLTARMA